MSADLRALLQAALTGLLIAFAAFGLWTLFDAPAAPDRPGYAAAVSRAAPSVVKIEAQRLDPGMLFSEDPLLRELFEDDPRASTIESQGSGIIVSADGYLLTNLHVVRDAISVVVEFADSRRLRAAVVGVDEETDIAVLLVETDHPLTPIAAGDDSQLAVGDVVLAIGHPYGIGQTVTQGVVSALHRQVGGYSVYDQFIQTDAAINPGSSGGALINANGELIGLNTSVYQGDQNTQGISFAIPARMLYGIVQQLVDHGEVLRSWLGIRGIDYAATRQGGGQSGVMIEGVFRDGPAARAGLRAGDVIQRLARADIPDVRALQYISSTIPPGAKVEVAGLRDGKAFSSEMTTGQRPR